MSNIIAVETITDAATFVENSGVTDWEWGGDSSADGFVDWIFKNCTEVDRDNYENLLREYLVSTGENPDDYL